MHLKRGFSGQLSEMKKWTNQMSQITFSFKLDTIIKL